MPTIIYYRDNSYKNGIGSYVKGLANSGLRWQEKYDSNFGIDFNFFKDRLSGRFDYYIANTKGMIADVTVPATTGFSTYVANLGEAENKGWELYLNSKVYHHSRNYVNVYATVAHNKNTLKKISNSLRAWNDEQDATMLEDGRTTPSIKYYEGCSMNAIWAVKSRGIDPQSGKEIFVKKDGRTTYIYDVNDQVVCGDSQPKFNGNFGVNGEFKGIGFSLTTSYRWGGEIYNSTLVNKVENAPIEYNVDRRVFTDRWQKPGDQTDIPRFVYGEPATSTNSSRYIHSTDHLRLKNFTLGFTLPNQWTQKLMIDKVRIYFSGNNLLTWAKWKQYDPETPVNGEVFCEAPAMRTFSFGAQLSF